MNGRGALRHAALLYRDEDEYVTGTGRFVREGLAAGEPVFVAAPVSRHRAVDAALGDAAGSVRVADMAEVGRNPGRILPLIADWASEHPGRRTRFVGEPMWPGRTAAEVDEVIGHEALINLALGAVPISVLCPCHVGRLPPAAVASVARTHPGLVCGDDHEDSPVYDGSAAALEVARSRLPSPGAPLLERDYGFEELHTLRALVAEAAARLGLSRARVEDLVLAAAEAAANTVRHAGGRGTLRLWADDGQLVCELADDGLIGDPLAGRRRPRQDEDHGRGLWLIHQLCDLVQVRSGPDGTTVRMHMRRDLAAGRA